MRMAHLRRCIFLAAGLGLMLGATGPAKASLTFGSGTAANPTITVVIDDQTEGPITAKVNGSTLSNFVRTGEFVSFLLSVPAYSQSPATASRELHEAGTGAFSDRLLVTPWTTTALAVSLGSDPAATFPGTTQFTPLTENNTFQNMFFATMTNAQGVTTGVVQFTVASNPVAVPEASTIVTAASAVPFVLGFWWRKRRRATV